MLHFYNRCRPFLFTMEIGTQKIDILMQSYLTDDDLKALFNLLCDDILNSGLKELPKFYDVKGCFSGEQSDLLT